MFGSAAAISFAFTAALIKVVGNYAAKDWVGLFVHWQTYGLVVFGLAGLLPDPERLPRRTAGGTSQSTLVLVDPLASILFGIALYGDSLRTANPWGPLEAFSLLVMFAGAVFLSNSPLVTGLRGEGKGAEYEDLLSRRVKHFGREEVELADNGLPPFSPT